MLPRLLLRLLRRCFPVWFKQLRCWHCLAFRFGQYKSLVCANAIDANGHPLPWYTYPAIEFLSQLDFDERSVFEWGAGNSTLYWARRCASVASVESDEGWYEHLRSNKPNNAEVVLLKDAKEYVTAPRRWERKFDVMAIDGDRRLDCALEAPQHLSEGGIIVLDNADSHTDVAGRLRDLGFVEIDFSGFGPNNHLTWVTSIFFKQRYDFPPRSNVQPTSGIGGLYASNQGTKSD